MLLEGMNNAMVWSEPNISLQRSTFSLMSEAVSLSQLATIGEHRAPARVRMTWDELFKPRGAKKVKQVDCMNSQPISANSNASRST